MPRPHVLLSAATSIDGYIDDASDNRLLLSNDADFDRVDEVRASVDAILVGANTVRRDDPRLLVRSAARRDARVAAGRVASPARVVLAGTRPVAPTARVFTEGDTDVLVFGPTDRIAEHRADLTGTGADVIAAGDPVDVGAVLDELGDRGVGRLLVEGGGAVHTSFLSAGLVDELHLVVAPFLVGDPRAPKFVGDGPFAQGPDTPFRLAEARPIGDVVLLRYLLR